MKRLLTRLLSELGALDVPLLLNRRGSVSHIGALATHVSHELRASLTTIILNLLDSRGNSNRTL